MMLVLFVPHVLMNDGDAFTLVQEMVTAKRTRYGSCHSSQGSC